MGAALVGAAWMTAMERNSDLIVIASYASLLVDVNLGGPLKPVLPNPDHPNNKNNGRKTLAITLHLSHGLTCYAAEVRITFDLTIGPRKKRNPRLSFERKLVP
jgi:hypothetical protein